MDCRRQCIKLMNVLDLLPFVRGWGYEPTTLSNQTIKETTRVIDWNNKKGWFLWMAGSMNDPNVIIRIVTDQYYGKSITPLALYAGGLTTSNNTGVWVAKYDAVNSIYSPVYAPPYPLPFNSAIKIELTPSSNGPFTLINYGNLLITITDEKTFLKDLRRVLGKGLK
jgi:hypothetical protein